MNSLLKRQIRKHLGTHPEDSEKISTFINAVNLSYQNYEEQQKMIQRAMLISSDELFEANQKLKEKTTNQNKLIERLKNVINTLNKHQLHNETTSEEIGLDGEKLARLIDQQAKQIIKTNSQKEVLLKNLEVQNQELNEYAHIVSHDLKSPLRSIDTVINWIIEDYQDTLGDGVRKNLNLVLNNLEKMDLLINGILNYSTINKLETNVYDVDLQHLVLGVISSIYVPNNISITIIKKLPIVKGDKIRLEQLFQNLLTNAINYSDKPNGQIEIGVKEINGFWEFYIKDNGKGISEIYYEKIFKVFQKLQNNKKSTGIGLSIVKKIVGYYGGNISLKSKVGVGTTFYFTLPK